MQKQGNWLYGKKAFQRILAAMLAVVMLCTACPVSARGTVNEKAAVSIPTVQQLRNTKTGEYVSTVPTPKDSPVINPDYDRSYDNYEVTSKAGFLHPGILMNREELNIMRDMVWIGAEPWASVFEELQKSAFASLDYRPNGPFEIIASDRETYAQTRASTAVYELALMWYITGKKEYADKSIGIMMDWAETVKKDAKQDHLRIGTAMHKFCIAAEIFRYTPSSGWTQEHTQKLSAYLDLLNPAIDKSFQYYNQGGYALMAYMPKQIFQDNWEGYVDAVERLAYNKNYGWKDGNSVNFSLSAMVFNSGQFVEMGRDQEHAWDDLGFMSMVIKTTFVQGTKVDEKGNIVSIGGTDLYEYDNQKALKAAAYWQQYCMGEEPSFVANQNAWGEKTEFAALSNVYRGQTLMWSPSLYYHYLYTKGYKETDRRTILQPTAADPSTDPYQTYGDAYAYIGIGKDLSVDTFVRGVNVDFPDFQDLTFTPLAAIYDAPLKGSPKEAGSAVDNCADYNRYLADKLAGSGNGAKDTSVVGDRQNGGAITEPAVDEEGNAHFAASDIQNGEWLAYNIDFDTDFGPNVDTLVYTYGTRSTVNPKIDVYVGDWKEQPAESDYDQAVQSGKIGTLELGITSGYADYQSFAAKMNDSSKLQGKKTVYLYCYGSNNTFAFHGNCLWFKFVDSRAFDVNQGSSADIKNQASVEGTSAVLSSNGYIGWENMDFDSGFSGVTLNINTQAEGKLCLYVDGPGKAAGGKLIQTYDLAAATNGEVQFKQENDKAVTGHHAVYFVYEGNQLKLNSVAFLQSASSTGSFQKQKAGNYTSVVQGTAVKTGSNGLTLNSGSSAYVTYMNIPFLTGAQTFAVRVKSTGSNKLYFDDIITAEPSTPGTIGRGGNLAYFDLPDTAGMSADGFITLHFSLGDESRKITGNRFIGMGAEGTGIVEIDYFQLNPENTAPTLALYEQNESQALEQDIYVSAGEQKSYSVRTQDADGDSVQVSVYGEPPAGFTYTDGTLTVQGSAAAGEYQVQFSFTDGTASCIQSYVFHLQSSQDNVQKIIDDSGLEKHLLTFYLYDNARYKKYVEARDAALAASADNSKIEALKAAVADCNENMPVYSKVKFEFRYYNKSQHKDEDKISLYLDTKQEDEEKCIATASNLSVSDDKVKETDWISFTDKSGGKMKVAGNHNLTIWLSSVSIRLISFTLANEDESVTKQIDAVSITDLGAPSNFCINALDKSKGGTIPHEVRGAASWLLYTWPSHDDFSDVEFTGNAKNWPLKGKTGPGFDFELVPGILADMETAKTKLDEQSLYTTDSYNTLNTAYTNAKNAVDNYVQQKLTADGAADLEKELEEAIAELKQLEQAVKVVKDDSNTELLEFDATGHTNANGSNQSLNPTVVAQKGTEISFKLQVDARFTNPKVAVKQFGYRGSRGTKAEELSLIDPVISEENIQITTSNDNEFKVSWTGNTPGNYRALFEITSDTGTAEQLVEMVYRNQTKRETWAPKYVRMRFAGFRNDEEKAVELYLMDKDGSVSDSNKIATLLQYMGYGRAVYTYRLGGNQLAAGI